MPLTPELQAYFLSVPTGAEGELYEDTHIEPLIDGESYFRELGAALAALGKKSIAENQQAGEFVCIANLAINLTDLKVPNALGVLEPLETVLLDKAANGVDVRVLGWAHYALNPPFWSFRAGVGRWIDQPLTRVAAAQWNAETARLVRRLRAGAVGAGAALNVLSHPGGCSHIKLVIVGTAVGGNITAFSGGIDLGPDRYSLATHEGPANTWHDVMLKIQGRAVTPCYGLFMDLWRQNLTNPKTTFLIDGAEIDHMAAGATPMTVVVPAVPPPGGAAQFAQSLRTLPARTSTSTLVPDPPSYFWPPGGVFEIRDAILRAISQAKKYVYIEDQYFWSEEIFGALRTALQDAARPNLYVVLLTGAMQDPLDETSVKIHRDFILWNSLAFGLTAAQSARLKFGFRWGDVMDSVAPRHVIASVTQMPGDPTTDVVVSDVLATGGAIGADDLQGAGLAFSDGARTFKVKGNPPIAAQAPLRFHVSGGSLNPRMSALQPYRLLGAAKIFVHAKTVLIDDCWALIGSANHARRSMRTDLEHAVAFTSDDGSVVKDYRKSLWAHHVKASPAALDDLNTALDLFFSPVRRRPEADFPDYIEFATLSARPIPPDFAKFQKKFEADSTVPDWNPL